MDKFEKIENTVLLVAFGAVGTTLALTGAIFNNWGHTLLALGSAVICYLLWLERKKQNK